jgi:DNA-directed RNA polymerase specialized sigma24 family protein
MPSRCSTRPTCPRVYRFALKRLRDTAEAEDVAQEVFFTVFNVLDTYQGQAPLIVWVFGITRNTVNRRSAASAADRVARCARGRRGGGSTPPADRSLDARRMLRCAKRRSSAT